jgi:hypothetical protein
MRTVRRPRRYVDRQWIELARPLLRYSGSRDAFVLRLVGQKWGPVLRVERRYQGLSKAFDGVERRGGPSIA